MTFTFNTGIPASGNNPSVDQPDMLTNNVSTNSIIGVDHVTFNAASGGLHKQVTFNANNVPAIPTSPPVLFTNDVEGVAQLFYYSGNSTTTSDQYVNATVGSTYLLGGMIIKWGRVGSTADNATITFTTPFPNNCYSVTATPIKSGSFGSLIFTIKQTPTVASFVVRTNAVTLDGLTYIAIGD